MKPETQLLLNLVAYSLQLGVMIGVGALLASRLRTSDARVSLRYWQALGVAMFALLAVQLAPALGLGAAPHGGAVDMWFGAATVAQYGTSIWPSVSRFLLAAVLTGCALRLLWIGVGIAALRRYVRGAEPLPASALAIADLEERLGSSARYLVSTGLRQPVTFGWRLPTVLLPATFLELEPERKRAVLCHELLHVRRRDWIPFLLEEAVRTALWFHPGVHFLLGRIDLAREQVIDAEVVSLLGQRRLYLDVLLSFAGVLEPRRYLPATPFFRDRHLVERVRTLVTGTAKASPRAVVRAIVLVLVVGLAAGLAAWAVPLQRIDLGAAVGDPNVPATFLAVEGDVERPVRISGAAPEYTETARKQRIQGAVILRATIDAEGRVASLEPVQSVGGGLTEAAMAAVSRWRFEPATLDGRAVSVYYDLTVNFRLE